jgi:Ca2+-binding EF-hand superfamily protein
LVATGLVGGAAGSWITARRLNKKHNIEKEELLTFIVAQDNAHTMAKKKWIKDYETLLNAHHELEVELTDRDYEEFKAPDADNDNMISRSEFNTYVQKYLQSFPELSDKDFPKFEEFDQDNDGLVNFDEWEQFLAQQKLTDKKNAKDKELPSNDAGGKLYIDNTNASGSNGLQKRGAAKERR